MKLPGTAIRLSIFALLLAGCGSSSNGKAGDCASGVRCGTACCAAGEACTNGVCAAACVPNCTTDAGRAKQCGEDGCGGTCGTCLPTETCSAAFACEGSVKVGNDDCAQAESLVFDDDTGTAIAYGTTFDAAQNATLSCAQKPGLDVVYSFSIARRQKLTAVVQPMGDSALWPAVSVRTVCGDNSSDLACTKAFAKGEGTTLVLNNLTNGTYYLWVTGNTAGLQAAGRFRLTVALTEPDESAPANDTCAAATPIVFQNGHAEMRGDTTWADNDSSGAEACPAALGGGDVVYRLELAEPSGLMTRMTSVTPAAFTPAIYLGSSCTSLADQGCATNGKPEQYFRLPAGTHYLVVDSRAGLAGSFTLELTLGAAPANDTCAGAQELDLEPTNDVTVEGNTTFAGPDSQGQGDCAGAGHDLVYRFSISQDETVAFTVTPKVGSAFAPVVYVRATCDGSTGNDLACGKAPAMTPARTRVLRLPAGEYFVWVGSATATNYGAFTLRVEATPIVMPSNDGCAAPLEITLDDAGGATVRASTLFAADDLQGATCGAQATTDGADLVYTVVLDHDAALRAMVTRDGPLSALEPAVYLRTTCAGAGDERACGVADATTGSKAASVSLPMLSAGTYYLVVDALRGSAGEFKLEISTGAPVLNDTCASPEPIVIDAATGIGTVTADTSRANGDAAGSCQSAGTSSADIVYSLVFDDDKSVLFEVTPENGSALMPALFVRTDCANPDSELLDGCMMSRFVQPTALSFTVLPAGTYYVWIDGRSSAGALTLTVTTLDAPARPDGDGCTNVQPFGLVVTSDPNVLQGTATGDLTTARNDSQGVGYCQGARAPDLVYRLSLIAPQKVVAKLTPDLYSTGYQPVVYIRSACDTSSASAQLACAAAPQAGAAAQAEIHSLAQGDYFVWVDGMTTGRFSLEVTVSAPDTAAPANENCSAPASLSFVGDSASATGTTVGSLNDTRASQSAYAGGSGGDVVYTFATTGNQKIVATVTAATGAPATFKPAVIIRDNCATIASELAWDAATGSSQTATATVADAPAGTYFIWVDSAGTAPTTPGPFTLNVTLSAP